MPPVKKQPRQRHRHFLLEWREFNRLSQESVAEAAQMTRENYGKIESGQVPYKQDMLELLAERYRIPASYLLAVNPKKEDKPLKAYEMLSDADDPAVVDKALLILETLLAKEN